MVYQKEDISIKTNHLQGVCRQISKGNLHHNALNARIGLIQSKVSPAFEDWIPYQQTDPAMNAAIKRGLDQQLDEKCLIFKFLFTSYSNKEEMIDRIPALQGTPLRERRRKFLDRILQSSLLHNFVLRESYYVQRHRTSTQDWQIFSFYPQNWPADYD